MLYQKDGCLFVEWGKPLYHSITLDHFKSLLRTSNLHFALDSTFYDENEHSSAIQIPSSVTVPTTKDLIEIEPREFFFCHCWHASDGPGNDMFSGNDSSGRQIIIETNFRALFDSISSNKIFAGKVSYRKIEDFEMKPLTSFAQKFIKDWGFRNEEEFRLLIVRNTGENADPDHIDIPVNLELIINEILVRKTAASDLPQIEELVAKLGSNKSVKLLKW